MRQWQWIPAGAALLFVYTSPLTGQTDSTKADSVKADSVATDSAQAPALNLPPGLHAVGGDLRFTSISMGTSHACALTAEGKGYCWGKNTFGQLGDSTYEDRAEPTPVSAGIKFRVISAGGTHSCGISTFNEPYCWGNNEDGQIGNGTRVKANYPFRVAGEGLMTLIIAGPRHTCGTQKHWDKQDQALCWGYNADSQLGGMNTETSALPIPPFGVIRYVSMALGDRHTCGATREGRVFCWGDNSRGQLGNGSATESRVPFITRMNRRSDFTAVAAGSGHTCALSGTGDVVCWGENTAGQVGSGGKGGRVLSPTGLKDATDVAAIYAAGNATCAQRKDGSMACWGSNADGHFGSPDAPSSRTPVPAFAGVAFKQFSLGVGGGCGLVEGGTAVCWGQKVPAGSQ